MKVCSSITTSAKHVVHFSECVRRQMCGHVCSVVSHSPSNTCCFYFRSGEFQLRYAAVTITRRFSRSFAPGSQTFRGCCIGSRFSQQSNNSHPLMVKRLESSRHRTRCLGISLPCQNISLRLLMPKQEVTKIRWSAGSASWLQASVILGLLVCFSSSKPVYSEAARGKNNNKDDCDSSLVSSSHGKKVYTDYSITGIPGDGRCLFRSVAHGACLRSGKQSPSETLQRELADELRARVADEFVRRREETEWFVEGDFETYVSQIRKPHVWGGEPELFMASHVLQMPITVYMHDKNAGGLIAIAEYGQEYGKEDPIRVLYHGFGHYDALQIPEKKGGKSKL